MPTEHARPDAPCGILRCPPDSRLRILQLTDFHNDAGEEFARRSWDEVRDIVAKWQPHFIALSGDIWCGDEQPEQAATLMARDLAELEAIGIPWAFAWGNHDYMGNMVDDIARLERAPFSLMRGCDPVGNCRVELRDPEGNRPLLDLYFLNSRDLWRPEEDWAWFDREAERLRGERNAFLPSLVFFHIPLTQYEDARLSGSYVGTAREAVLCWGDDGTGAGHLERAGGVRACFCGHSHANDFSFERNGIVYAYGRASGHGGYGGDKLAKGGKLIDVNALDATEPITLYTVFADGSEWHPVGHH